MFNISFGEILVFVIIALIILGPEKLPQTLRSTMIKYRQFKNTLNKIQQDFENELELAELKSLMDEELKKIRENEEKLKLQLTQMQNEIDQLNQDLSISDSKPVYPKIYQYSPDKFYMVPYCTHPNLRVGINKEYEIKRYDIGKVA